MRIRIVVRLIPGYGAGTRLVINAIYQLSLLHRGMDVAAVRQKLRIGRVILAGSDFERGLFGAYLQNGLLKVCHDLAVYMSEKNQAMGISRRLFNRERLGQTWQPDTLSPGGADFLEANPSLRLINVTQAEWAAIGNGHAYFLASPWVSSDILISMLYGLAPAQRGLEHSAKALYWQFPEDYVARLGTFCRRAPVRGRRLKLGSTAENHAALQSKGAGSNEQ